MFSGNLNDNSVNIEVRVTYNFEHTDRLLAITNSGGVFGNI